MTSFSRDWTPSYEAEPSTVALISETGAQELQATKTNIRERMEVEHYWAEEDGSDGVHKFPWGPETSKPIVGKAGQIFISTEKAVLNIWTSDNEWEEIGFQSGCSMLFKGTVVQPGWTLDATHNDRVIRVVNTATAGTGGAWTITGMQNVAAVNLSNSFETGPALGDPSNSAAGTLNPGGVHHHSVTVSFTVPAHAHTFDGNWRPAYLNLFLAIKD